MFALLDLARSAYRAGAEQALSYRQAMFAEPDIPQEWLEWYERTAEETLWRYTERSRRRITEIIAQATLEGQSHDEMAKSIKDAVTGLLTWQAERIARTESMRLWNLGHLHQMQQFEEIVGYEYSVVLDPRTSHICRPLTGKKVRKEELQYVPPLHPHCRTTLLPVFAGEDVRWEGPEEIRPAKGFGKDFLAVA